MSGQGINVAQECHVVNVLPPIDVNGGKAGDRFSLKNHGHATIIVQVGVSAAAMTSITVLEYAAATGGSGTAIAFKYAKEETAAGDTLTALADATTSGITSLTANDNVFYVIEVDARALSDGYPWLEVVLTNGSGNSVIASAIAILSGSRYGNDANATAIA